MAIIQFYLPDGTAPAEVYVTVAGSATSATLPAQGPITITPDPSYRGQSMDVATDGGVWALTLDAPQLLSNAVSAMNFPALPRAGSTVPWWHTLHNVTASARNRGKGIKIGIIDEALAIQGPQSCISHIFNEFRWAGSPTASSRATTPKCTHGQAVSSLLASMPSTGSGFEGVAPGADYYFCAAGSDSSQKLKKSSLVSCVDYLANYRKCDIISISAGDSQRAMPEVDAAVSAAADVGTMCFVAAGNEVVPQYPALYSSCLAVAALGERHRAPIRTSIKTLDDDPGNDILSGDVYLWKKSARGAVVDFCAAGVGVIWNKDGEPEQAAFGTSFACPIAAGVAAILLSRDVTYLQSPRDRSRWSRALQVLTNSCRPFGCPSENSFWKHGRMWL